jgi:MCP family monocarboxylic acid transporter-like MFS transporter 10
MFDIGHFRVPLFFWSVVMVLSCFLIAECRVYWQYLLVQGLMVGVSSGQLLEELVLTARVARVWIPFQPSPGCHDPLVYVYVLFVNPLPDFVSLVRRRRSLAFGVSAIGSSVGGTIFPILARSLEKSLGYAHTRRQGLRVADTSPRRFKWALRIIGVIIFALLAFANIVRALQQNTKLTADLWCRYCEDVFRQSKHQEDCSTLKHSRTLHTASTSHPHS